MSVKRSLSGTPAHPGPIIGPPDEVKLTDAEERLASLLLDVVRSNRLETVVRFAGGWVRDKLLGIQGDDIDVTLDNMMGREFAELVRAHAAKDGTSVSRVGVVKVNPEQSKHLETATVHINDKWVDFVNLRAETYTADSRIPGSIGFGSPLEDALRRDITINTLFYNIATRCVEDFTRLGRQDLRDHVVRTPIEPRQTFLDDPLRMLRVVRFAARFDFELHEHTFDGLKDPACLDALRNKVSRERVGIELGKMLKAQPVARAIHALELIGASGVYQAIMTESRPAPWDKSKLIELASLIDDSWYGQDVASRPDDVRLLLLAYATRAFAREEVIEHKKTVPKVLHISRDLLKLPNADTHALVSIHRAAAQLPGAMGSALSLCRVVREAGPMFSAAAVLAAAECSDSTDDNAGGNPWEASDGHTFLAMVASYMKEWRLDGCWALRPLYNGEELSKLVGERPGPAIGKASKALIEWQALNPDAGKTEAEAWLASGEWRNWS